MTESVHPADDLDLVRTAAAAAARIAFGYFRRDAKIWRKEGGSPVTEADIAADEYLRDRLTTQRPSYGWLSEETVDTPDRLERSTLFVVDPIDGTRGFVDGDPRWCISIAVVTDNRPVAAVIHAPALGSVYSAAIGQGAYLDGQRITASELQNFSRSRLSGPKRWINGSELADHVRADHLSIPSLALRLAYVADATIDGAFARPRSHDWDIAAADLLVHEAGGVFSTLGGSLVQYNLPTTEHGTLAAAGPAIHNDLLDAVRTLAKRRSAQT